MSLNTKLAGWLTLTRDTESLQSTQADDDWHGQRPDKAILNLQFV
jgi:hypothetical protein